MKKRKNSIRVRSPFEIAEALGLDKEDAIAMEFRARLNVKIIELVKKNGLTHKEVAKRAGASRTRVTAILNGHTMGISTDFLLRIIYSLGVRTAPTFYPIGLAA